MNYLKSVGAVLAGFVAITALSLGTDVLLSVAGVFPDLAAEAFPTWVLLVSIGYFGIYSALGGVIVARLAPRNPMAHVWALAVLGLTSGIASSFASWEVMPHWYCIALVILSPLCVLAGGRHAARR